MPSSPEILSVGICAVAAFTDLRSGTIPNWLTLPVLGAGLWVQGIGAVTGALLCGIVPFLLHRLRAMGGGDVKLFAVLGALLGAGAGLEAELAAFCIGGVTGVALWVVRGELVGRLRGLLLAGRPGFRGTEIRFAPCILAGAVLVAGAHSLGAGAGAFAW